MVVFHRGEGSCTKIPGSSRTIRGCTLPGSIVGIDPRDLAAPVTVLRVRLNRMLPRTLRGTLGDLAAADGIRRSTWCSLSRIRPRGWSPSHAKCPCTLSF